MSGSFKSAVNKTFPVIENGVPLGSLNTFSFNGLNEVLPFFMKVSYI